MRRLIFGALVTMAAVAYGLAGSASAGEITGKNTRPMVIEVVDGHTVLHAKSACAFSGLNDEFIEGDPSEPRTQSWGSIPKAGRDGLPPAFHPGQACRGQGSAPAH